MSGGISNEGGHARGNHVFLDYVNFFTNEKDIGLIILEIMRDCVNKAGVKEVHSHVEIFDGLESPPGFASIVLIDESHVTAHCYSEDGLLAIDVFTCGNNNPNIIADSLHNNLLKISENLKLIKRSNVKRFVNKGE